MNDENAIEFYKNQAAKARASGDLAKARRNEVVVRGIQKRMADRAREGIQPGDADGYVEVRGGTGLCLIMVFVRLLVFPFVLIRKALRRP